MSMIYDSRTHARIAAGAALAVAVVVVFVVPGAGAADVHHLANGAGPARGRVRRAVASPRAAGAGPPAMVVLVGAP